MISLHGIDLSFMKSDESKKALAAMREDAKKSRAEPHSEPKRSDLYAGKGAYVLPDLHAVYPGGGFVSPIDGTFISSRSQLRAHNARHGVIQTGDIRGPQIRENMKRHMQYDPSLVGKDFSWGKQEGSERG